MMNIRPHAPGSHQRKNKKERENSSSIKSNLGGAKRPLSPIR